MNSDDDGEKTGDGRTLASEDPPAGLLRELVTSTPPKSLDTVTAASEAAEKAETQGTAEMREHRIRTRAYELWEREDRPEGRPADFWLQAEAEIAREER